MKKANLTTMGFKYFLIASLFVIYSSRSVGQKIESTYDINLLVSQINTMDLKTGYEYNLYHCDNPGCTLKDSITYKFMCDLKGKLLKVIVKDDNYKQTKDYYFHNDQLVYIKSRFGMSYFYDHDFSVGSTWKDENDIGLLKREKEIAAAYRLINMYKKECAR